MPNVELIRDIFIYYNMFKFQVDLTIIFIIIVYTDRHTHQDTQTDRQTDTHTDGHEYSIVVIDKPQL